MAAKRSPILGYNHNVRFRGIVFHIQTEDSGIGNPHVFSHLFHGGVILSTRKLVYDAGSNEDAVKSLMQAQHKAVMKDLRRGTFDDKIDAYLADAPGLLPRESVQIANAARASAEALASSEAIAELLEEGADGSAPIAIPVSAAEPVIEHEPSAPEIELIDVASGPHPDEEPSIEIIAAKPAAFLVEDDDLFDATPLPELSRAATVRLNEAQWPAAMASPEEPLVAPPRTRTDISAAMNAIQIPEDFDEAPVEIHSPALPSAPTPPGAAPERVGEYHLARKSTVIEAPPAPARPPIPRPTPVASRVPTPSSGRPPMIPGRPPTAPVTRTPPPVTPTRPSTFRNQSPPEARPRAPTPQPRTPLHSHTQPMPRAAPQAPVPRVPTQPRAPTADVVPGTSRAPIQPPRRPATGGGVVVSRPAVIVGGKSGPTSPPTKVRRAKDAESFGGDLISERSLDEVILAYLSEDNSED